MATPKRSSWERACEELEARLSREDPAQAADLAALDRVRVGLLGRKGALTELLKALKDLSLEDRRALGPRAQGLKTLLEGKIAERQNALERTADERKLSAELDLTLPGLPQPRGRRHPLTQILDEMTRILSLMGFSWAEGPHVEDDRHNFSALNIPEHHPARDLHDTLYLADAPLLLRTHTSPVQIRSMEARRPPLRIMCPGRVFRHEAVDATHSAVFHQLEGLYVERGVTFADLKATLAAFMEQLLGSSEIRLRPSFFPFTEPSAEVDVRCLFCSGRGCPVCKQSGWLELLGAGLVHPNVLKAVDIDPERWSGFAFGIGVERLAMLKLGVKDIRQFYENDVRFLRQFDENIA